MCRLGGTVFIFSQSCCAAVVGTSSEALCCLSLMPETKKYNVPLVLGRINNKGTLTLAPHRNGCLISLCRWCSWRAQLFE